MAAKTVLAAGACTSTPGTVASPAASSSAAVLAAVAFRCHSDVPNMAFNWADRNRVFDDNWVVYLMIGASTSWGTRFDNTTTASAPLAPFFVAPKEIGRESCRERLRV